MQKDTIIARIAACCDAVEVNANWLMKIEIVKPMPAIMPTCDRCFQFAPCGN
ncbi:MAG: hypothetical protein RLZ39_1210 [Bacteroidota bacterium]